MGRREEGAFFTTGGQTVWTVAIVRERAVSGRESQSASNGGWLPLHLPVSFESRVRSRDDADKVVRMD